MRHGTSSPASIRSAPARPISACRSMARPVEATRVDALRRLGDLRAAHARARTPSWTRSTRASPSSSCLTEHIPAQHVLEVHAAREARRLPHRRAEHRRHRDAGRGVRRHHAGAQHQHLQARPCRRDLALGQPRHADLPQPDAGRPRSVGVPRHRRRPDDRHDDARRARGARPRRAHAGDRHGRRDRRRRWRRRRPNTQSR